MTAGASPRLSISFLSSCWTNSKEEQDDTTTHKPDSLAVTDRACNDKDENKRVETTSFNENDLVKQSSEESSDRPASQEDWIGPESYDDGVSVISDRTRTHSVKHERRPSLLSKMRQKKKKSEPQVDISKRPHYGYEIF